MSDLLPVPAVPQDGVLLTVAGAKRYIIGLEYDDDDLLISELILEAEASLQGYIGNVLIAAETTQVYNGGVPYFRLRNFPVKVGAPFVVRDLLGGVGAPETLDPSRYRISGILTGILEYGSGSYEWPRGGRRYEVRYTGGLDQRADWATVVSPRLRGTIRDLVADWYENRNPSTTSESSGVGVAKAKIVRDIPPDILAKWDDYRPLVV